MNLVTALGGAGYCVRIMQKVVYSMGEDMPLNKDSINVISQ